MKQIFFIVIAFVFVLPIFALSIPDHPGSYVNDYAHILSPDVNKQLASKLKVFDDETSNQIVVATFNSLEGESLEDFSVRLAQKWKAGNKEKDNGVLLLVFKDDRKVRIEVGYGLEGALTDALCSQIIRNEIVPSFKGGSFDNGIISGVDAIIKATKGEYTNSGKSKKNLELSNGFTIALLLFFMLPILAYIVILYFCITIIGFPYGLVVAMIFILILDFVRRIMTLSTFGQTFTGHGGGFYGGGFGGGSFGDGGFSGFSGGGSFGGGGSSGNW